MGFSYFFFQKLLTLYYNQWICLQSPALVYLGGISYKLKNKLYIIIYILSCFNGSTHTSHKALQIYPIQNDVHNYEGYVRGEIYMKILP